MCSGLFYSPPNFYTPIPALNLPIQNFSTHFMSVTLHFLLLLIPSVGGGQSLEG
jgi:hypothetical protein